MRITDLDRRQAIKRFPEFKKDCARYKRYKKLNSDKISSFLLYFEKKWGYKFEAILHADEVAKQRKDSRSVKAVVSITDTPYLIVNKCKGEKITSQLNKPGKALYLKVDLKGRTETQLVKDFRETIVPYIEIFNKQISEDVKKERNRKTDRPEGIWAIYEMYIETGKKINETTRKYFSVLGNPSGYYDGDGYFDDKYLKRAQKSINNAEAIINAVRKEYGLK